MKQQSLQKDRPTNASAADLCEADASEMRDEAPVEDPSDDTCEASSEVSGQYDDIELFGLPWSGQRLNSCSENSSDVDENPTAMTPTSSPDSPRSENTQVRISHLNINEKHSPETNESSEDTPSTEDDARIEYACAYSSFSQDRTANQKQEKYVE